jgi:hypothetical protein
MFRSGDAATAARGYVFPSHGDGDRQVKVMAVVQAAAFAMIGPF